MRVLVKSLLIASTIQLLGLYGFAQGVTQKTPEEIVSENKHQNLPSNAVRIGFTAQSWSDVDIRDAQIATDVWVNELAKKMGVQYSAKSIIYPDKAELSEGIRNGKIDLTMLPSTIFAELDKQVELIPAFTSTTSSNATERYVILVQEDSNISSLADLKDKRISLLTGTRGEIALIWLEVLLHRQNLETTQQHFSDIKPISKPGKAVYPLFFGKIDACLVTRSSFETMIELNPQLHKRLKVLEESPEVLVTVLCYSAHYAQANQDLVTEVALALHNSPDGKQILSLFRTKQLMAYEPHQMDEVKLLLEEYAKIPQTEAVSTPEKL